MKDDQMTRFPDDQGASGHPVIRLSGHLARLTGWRRNLTAFVLGTLMTLTLAPFFIFPLIIPSFTGLYWLVESAPSRRRRFFDGWWWGWGFYMTGLYWFCVALLTDADSFGWLIPFALFGLTGVIAIYSGVACWLMSWVRGRGIGRLVVFSIIWTVVEYARGHLFSGFPWNLPGYSFGFSTVSLQMASLVGVYGLTLFTVLLGSSFAVLNCKNGTKYGAILWGVFAFGLGWGQWRIAHVDQAYVDGVMLRLVQANISQPHKWDPKLQMQGLRDNVRLTQSPGLDKITHVIWPETAVPYAIEPDKSLVHMLGSALPRDTMLLTGGLHTEGEDKTFRIWNSMVMIAHDGAILGTYDKIHLVPFGEFQPLRDFVPKEWMTPVGDTDFSRGAAVHTLQWPGLPPMIPLICYEAIFPEMSFNAEGEQHPGMLLTITNDAWFGMSIGPYQHFHMARMRAVEQGVPLVRVANTGISAVVDGMGRITASLPLGEQGVLDAQLPKELPDPTIYHNYANFITILGLSALILTIFRNKIPE